MGLLFCGCGMQGTINLADAAVRNGGVQHFVLLSSLLTNAPAVGQAGNPNYKASTSAQPDWVHLRAGMGAAVLAKKTARAMSMESLPGCGRCACLHSWTLQGCAQSYGTQCGQSGLLRSRMPGAICRGRPLVQQHTRNQAASAPVIPLTCLLADRV